jgi:hypothetical protein
MMDAQSDFGSTRRGAQPKVSYLQASKNPLLRRLGLALTELETMIDHYVRSASWMIPDDNYHLELEAYYLERDYIIALIAGVTPATTPKVQEYLDTSIYVHLSKRLRSLRAAGMKGMPVPSG